MANLPALIDAVVLSLEQARSIDDVKAVHDRAAALQRLTKGVDGARDAYNRCGEIKIYAERKMGDELARAEIKPGQPKKNSTPREPFFSRPRLEDLGISKKQSSRYQQLAAIPECEIRAHITTVKRDGGEVTTAGTLRLARQAEKHAAKVAPVLPAQQYNCIYADPPWRFGDGTTDPSRTIERQYPTLSLDEIKALPVPAIAAKDCILFLWTTAPLLAESMEVIPAWGFRYKSCAVWDKERIGMGHYFRIQHELLLIAARGSPGTPADTLLESSVYREKRGKHSAKPEWFRRTIEAYYPSAKRIELFARLRAPGWASWGDEAL